MARSRNLKPGFFKNEALAECQPLARILFQGLWCMADREGRLEDRPKRIKAELLPYDEVDVVVLLAELEEGGFITRYTVDNNDYIAVVKFAKHQNPHHREMASVIPAPGQLAAQQGQAPVELQAGPEQAQGLPQPSPEQAVLIPDSLNLIPDSLEEQKSPPPAPKIDPVKDMIDAGIEYMASSGVQERQARSVIGLLRKQIGDDLVVCGLLDKARRDCVADPVAWLMASAKSKVGQCAPSYAPVAGEV